jgi:hypothetical protein
MKINLHQNKWSINLVAYKAVNTSATTDSKITHLIVFLEGRPRPS